MIYNMDIMYVAASPHVPAARYLLILSARMAYLRVNNQSSPQGRMKRRSAMRKRSLELTAMIRLSQPAVARLFFGKAVTMTVIV